MIYDKSHYRQILIEKIVLKAFVLLVICGVIVSLDYAFNDDSSNSALILLLIVVIALGVIVISFVERKLIYDIQTNESFLIKTFVSNKEIVTRYNTRHTGCFYEYYVTFDEGGELMVCKNFYNDMEIEEPITLVLTPKLHHIIQVEASSGKWKPDDIFHVDVE